MIDLRTDTVLDESDGAVAEQKIRSAVVPAGESADEQSGIGLTGGRLGHRQELAIVIDDAASDDAPGLEPDGHGAGLVPLQIDRAHQLAAFMGYRHTSRL